MPTATFTEGVHNISGSGQPATIETVAGIPRKTVLTFTGSLPAGLTFIDRGDGTALIQGTPAAGTAVGSPYNLVIIATNAPGSFSTENFVLVVNSVPSFSSDNHALFVEGQAGSFIVTTSVTPIPTIGAVGLPTGLALVDNLDGTAVIQGTPVLGTARLNPYVATVQAINIAGNVTQQIAVTVTRAPAFK